MGRFGSLYDSPSPAPFSLHARPTPYLKGKASRPPTSTLPLSSPPCEIDFSKRTNRQIMPTLGRASKVPRETFRTNRGRQNVPSREAADLAYAACGVGRMCLPYAVCENETTSQPTPHHPKISGDGCVRRIWPSRKNKEGSSFWTNSVIAPTPATHNPPPLIQNPPTKNQKEKPSI